MTDHNDPAVVAAENIPHTGTCTRREGTGKHTLNNDTDIIRKAFAPMQAELDEAKAEIERLNKKLAKAKFDPEPTPVAENTVSIGVKWCIGDCGTKRTDGGCDCWKGADDG